MKRGFTIIALLVVAIVVSCLPAVWASDATPALPSKSKPEVKSGGNAAPVLPKKDETDPPAPPGKGSTDGTEPPRPPVTGSSSTPRPQRRMYVVERRTVPSSAASCSQMTRVAESVGRVDRYHRENPLTGTPQGQKAACEYLANNAGFLTRGKADKTYVRLDGSNAPTPAPEPEPEEKTMDGIIVAAPASAGWPWWAIMIFIGGLVLIGSLAVVWIMREVSNTNERNRLDPALAAAARTAYGAPNPPQRPAGPVAVDGGQYTDRLGRTSAWQSYRTVVNEEPVGGITNNVNAAGNGGQGGQGQGAPAAANAATGPNPQPQQQAVPTVTQNRRNRRRVAVAGIPAGGAVVWGDNTPNTPADPAGNATHDFAAALPAGTYNVVVLNAAGTPLAFQPVTF